MRYAIVEGGIVVNVVTAESAEFAASQGWIAIPDGQPVTFEWTWDGTTFAEPSPEIEP